MVDLLLRPANDSVRPLPAVELALKVRPISASPGAANAWALDPQYDAWAARHFPSERIYYCPLAVYDRLVRTAGAPHTLEEIDARLRGEAALSGGYALDTVGRWWPRTAMFAVGATSCRALLEFLFRWG